MISSSITETRRGTETRVAGWVSRSGMGAGESISEPERGDVGGRKVEKDRWADFYPRSPSEPTPYLQQQS